MRYMLFPALFAAGALLAPAAPPVYKLQTKIKIGGATSWDYVYVDSTNHRLYVSHWHRGRRCGHCPPTK